ncbi:MAG: prolyl-tRNA synthetase associated domain-containing protein [Bacteroidales bacterium]|nr:prolyl-tRNA synthetase associated domain-containing protein [Bacteroidales bacterium]
MVGQQIVFDRLDQLGITYDYLEHPEAPTIEIARQYWKNLDSTHCKNLFFRNHKGNKHYLVIVHCDYNLDIHALEKVLGEGKLSFASPERMMKYLGLRPGSVSPFGLLNDQNHEVIVFFDENLLKAQRLSFHPNDNRASLSVGLEDFKRYMDSTGNRYEWKHLYDSEP